MNTHVCTKCEEQVKPTRQQPGSFLMEIFLWLFFLLPGFIYSLYRMFNTFYGCPNCHSKDVVVLSSKRAKRILAA